MTPGALALGGLVLWGISLLWQPLTQIQALFLLAPLVLLSLGLPLNLAQSLPSAHLSRGILLSQPGAALSLWASFWLPPGLLAAGLALPWVLLTFACGLAGLLRHAPHGFTDAGEVALDAALLFLPVGGIWLLASRLGQPLMGFHEPLVLLTAMHFHFAGFCASSLAGLSGRLALPPTLYRLIVTGVLSGIPLLALGIAFWPPLELAAAAVFALSLGTLALLWLLRPPAAPLARWLLRGAALAVLASMGFALCFALAEFLGQIWVTIPQMAHYHGALNALGFALPGLTAFYLLQLPPAVAAGIPFSRLASRGFVGSDFFARQQALDADRQPTGLIEDFASYARPDFAPEQLAPEIRHFYEHTDAYDLFVTPAWQPGFRRGGRLWRALADRLGQMSLPIRAESRGDRIHSQILPIRTAADGRAGVRAWIRTYADTGRACYVAAYAEHRRQNITYMNIAFALPGGNMTSILRLDSLPDAPQRLKLSTWFPQGQPGDQGIYFVLRAKGFSLPIRLPLNETITVWCQNDAGSLGAAQPDDRQGDGDRSNRLPDSAALRARHDMWLCGRPFLTLDYFIYARQPV